MPSNSTQITWVTVEETGPLPPNKFFVGLHGDKTYNIIVCGNTT